MSYTQLILASSPMGYWKLNGSSEALVGNNANISNPDWTELPLIVQSGKALVVGKDGAEVEIDYEGTQLTAGYEWQTITFEFWFSLNNMLDGSGYLNNLNDETRYFNENTLKIVKIFDGSVEIGSILYDYTKNTMRFRFNGSNSDAYIPLRNLNSTFYVVATYSNKVTSLSVNGVDGVNGTVSDFQYFPINSSNIKFKINGESFNVAAKSFVMSDFAIYDYILKTHNMKQRVLLAFDSDKPTKITKTLGTSYFNFMQKEYQIASYEKLTKNSFSADVFDQNNVSFSYDEGITCESVNNFGLIGIQNINDILNQEEGGIELNSSSATLSFDKYSDMFKKYSYKTLTAQITPLNFPNFDFELMSIKNLLSGKSLVVRVTQDEFKIISLDENTETVIEIMNYTLPEPISSSFNLGLCFEGNACHAYINNFLTYCELDEINFDTGKELIIGPANNFSGASTSFVIKNFGMTSAFNSNFIDYNFEENRMFMARLKNNLEVSQVATWQKIINLSNYRDIQQTNIVWDGMDNCVVQVSDDNGATWTSLKRNQSIPSVLYNSFNSDKIIKILVPFEYKKELKNQSFNHIEYVLYKDLDIYSEDQCFVIVPEREDSTLPAYSIKRIPQTILMRQDNIGIKFEKIQDSVNGYAKIKPVREIYDIYAIDMWVRFDEAPNGFLDVVTKSLSPDRYIDVYMDNYDQGIVSKKYGLWFDENGILNFSPEILSVFVNSNQVSNGEYQYRQNEYTHLAVILNIQSKYIDAIYLNGLIGENVNFHSNATYGHLNIWQKQVPDSIISSRYQLFVDKNVLQIDDENDNLWQPDWQNDNINTFYAYKTG